MIKQGLTVKVSNLNPKNVANKILPDLFVSNRRKRMEGIVDSAIFDTFNQHWLVRHNTSGVINGISVGRYGIYHETELEIVEIEYIESPPPPKIPQVAYEINSEVVFFGDDW